MYCLLLLLLVSCGKEINDKSTPVQHPEITHSSINSQFVNTNPASKLPTLDFRLLAFGKQPSENAINCNGTLGNSGKVNGVSENEVRVTGDVQNGTIQFGHLSYVGATNEISCRAASKESYTYSITESVLTLCNVNCVNGVYPSCAANPCETFNEL